MKGLRDPLAVNPPAFVKRIVDAHGFEINLKSQPGKGTEFIIRIPIKN